MIIDIIQTIISFCKLGDQIKFIQMNSYVYNNSYIYSLYAFDESNIDQEIIEQTKFSRLQELHCCYNKNIYDIGHLNKTLKKLYCRGESKISQKCIDKLTNLEMLDCSYNENIFNVNHLAYVLIELNCSSEEEQLWIYEHYEGRKKLANSGITQDGILKLEKLKILKCRNNRNIYSVNHMHDTLEELDCSGDNNNINDIGICMLKKLRKLCCNYNRNIENLDIFSETLEVLRCCGGCCGVNQESINKLKKIIKLHCSYNPNIYSVNHLSDTLEELYINSVKFIDYEDHRNGTICGINQEGISGLKKIRKLDCSDNDKIYCIKHLEDTLECPVKNIYDYSSDSNSDSDYDCNSDSDSDEDEISEYTKD